MTNSMISRLTPFDAKTDTLNAVIETPKGLRNKFKYDVDSGLFKFDKTLPAGAKFPFDYGFIPSTLGEDGDPLDILVLMEEPTFTGCVIPARLIGGIAAEQTENDRTLQNDRLIAVAVRTPDQDHIQEVRDLNANLLEEIEHFFASYNEMEGKQFKSKGHYGAEQARERIREGRERFQKSKA
ncbi:MAG: inorganic diphosphatase [Chthonomonadales bacterium]|nr:inorganic diphosphatase [Chthonomonadales bacterium]